MNMAVTVAKSFDENALGLVDYFETWFNNRCEMSGIGLDPVAIFGLLLDVSDSFGISKGCLRKDPAWCLKPKPHLEAPKVIPSRVPKDLWDGETPPTNDVPAACVNTRFGVVRTKCKTALDIEGAGYTYEDVSGTLDDIERPRLADLWSIKCPSKDPDEVAEG